MDDGVGPPGDAVERLRPGCRQSVAAPSRRSALRAFADDMVELPGIGAASLDLLAQAVEQSDVVQEEAPPLQVNASDVREATGDIDSVDLTATRTLNLTLTCHRSTPFLPAGSCHTVRRGRWSIAWPHTHPGATPPVRGPRDDRLSSFRSISGQRLTPMSVETKTPGSVLLWATAPGSKRPDRFSPLIRDASHDKCTTFALCCQVKATRFRRSVSAISRALLAFCLRGGELPEADLRRCMRNAFSRACGVMVEITAASGRKRCDRVAGC